jgi:uncharacterized protein (UPF0548 family)
VFLLRRPTAGAIERFRAAQTATSFSYPEVGASRALPAAAVPAGYRLDHNRVRVGEGAEAFARATAAVRAWRMFALGWVELHPEGAPIAPGTTVAILAHHYGFWSLHAARVVYLVEEEGPLARFGFAYGTLTDHGERGEERFTVVWDREEGAVWYDLLAFSRPRHWLARVGHPLARLLQKRFARDSLRAMAEACAWPRYRSANLAH